MPPQIACLVGLALTNIDPTKLAMWDISREGVNIGHDVDGEGCKLMHFVNMERHTIMHHVNRGDDRLLLHKAAALLLLNMYYILDIVHIIRMDTFKDECILAHDLIGDIIL